jgi:hypothetical protein
MRGQQVAEKMKTCPTTMAGWRTTQLKQLSTKKKNTTINPFSSEEKQRGKQ